MRLCSSIPGRERWEVEALADAPELAAALETSLLSHDGVVKVRASAVSGRVLVFFSPTTLVESVETLLREVLRRLLSRKNPGAEAGVDSGVASSRALRELLPERARLVRPLVLSVVSHGLSISQGLLVVATLNAALAKRSGLLRGAADSRFGLVSGLLMLFTGVNQYVQHARKRAWRQLARNHEHALRARLLAAIEAQDLATLDAQGTGRLLSLVTKDAARLASFLERDVDDAVNNALVILVSGTLLLTTSPLLVLVACLPVPFMVPLLRKLGRKTAAARMHQNEEVDRFTQHLENSFAGIVDIKSFTAEREDVRRLSESARRLADAELDAAESASLEAHLMQGAFATGFVVMTLYGGWKARKGLLSSEVFARTMYLFPQVLGALGGVGGALGSYHSAVSSAARLQDMLASRPGIQGGPVRLPKARVRGEVRFDDVSFGYEPSTTVLHGVSLHLRPGETLAIVGPTGSGKSTLLKLLLRFHDVRSGSLQVDGHELRSLDLEDLRAAIGIVGQEPFLFEGTVKDNVLLGEPGASDAEVAEALDHAGALQFVQALPDRMDAQVGERGRKLSGGQRQRIAIARALLKKAPILALDEATSHLDYETEAAIQRSVRNASTRMSMIVVAHRLSTIRHADQILVLDQGRVREQGRHEALLARGGLYAFLWSLQQGE
ncbi:ABC transporter ATP-binding protein/permease [Myxococcus sp. K15C18031901]|uniref:ABC transporter ATP-binding protein n=1 Tax=Myxococcus dinghuensis TaxID=2906761 RepID=UPI0020A75BFE|nr:ABC transporter ATP-binding protein [Myxococcus dinghuensis]MCP3101649.1 ABC transporter ATP-binding protein/permease [Myxococcus dinghuensis]